MEAGEGGGEAFVVAGEPAEAGGPAEGALDHPAPGQQDEAALGVVEFDDLQLDPVRGGGRGGLGAGVALVNVSQLILNKSHHIV